MTDINYLFELNELAIEEAKNYSKKRELFELIYNQKGKHFIGITGSRGVGKTVLLKQITASKKNSFYISMDTLKEGDLFEIVKNLNKKYAFSVFLIDEIHFHDNYEQKLKKIYDFLDVRVIFSSSVSLAMHEASYDLSRRIQLINLYPFSFREYIYFKKDILLPKLSIEDIHDKKWEPEHLRFEYLFEEYLMGGLFPFGLDEPQILPLLKNILKKIIFKDIPSFAQLMTDELDILDKVIKFIGT